MKQKINLLGGVYLAQGVTGSPIFDDIKNSFPTTGLAGATTVGSLIISIINLLLSAVGLISALFILIGAYQYVASRGNEEATETAKKTLTYAVWGLVIAILAFAIINIVANALMSNTL